MRLTIGNRLEGMTNPQLGAYIGIHMALFLANLLLASWKMWTWVKTLGRAELSIGLVCLCFEWSANFLRTLQSLLWPSFNMFTLSGAELLLTLSGCLSLIASILVIFFWFDLTEDPFYHEKGKFLGVLKIPAIAVCSSLLMIELLVDILREYVEFDSNFVCTTLYAVFHVTVAIFYFVSAKKILSVLDVNNNTNKKKIIEVTYRIVGSGVATILASILLIFNATSLCYDPTRARIIWFFMDVMLFFQSLSLILIFKLPNANEKKIRVDEDESGLIMKTIDPCTFILIVINLRIAI